MKYEELNSFTYDELNNFTWNELEKDTFELLKSVKDKNIPIPPSVVSKLDDLCLESIKKYEEATGKKFISPPKTSNLSKFQNGITTANTILNIAKHLKDSAILKSLYDIFISLFS